MQVAISYLKLGQDKFARPIYSDILNKATLDLSEAKKDNDFIYHERIPDVKLLEPVPKAVLAKTSTVPPKLSSKFKGTYLNYND